MDFSTALLAVKAGRRIRRAIWNDGEHYRFCWLQLVQPDDADGRSFMPQLVIGYPAESVWRPFAGSNWDLLAEDWEIVEP